MYILQFILFLYIQRRTEIQLSRCFNCYIVFYIKKTEISKSRCLLYNNIKIVILYLYIIKLYCIVKKRTEIPASRCFNYEDRICQIKFSLSVPNCGRRGPQKQQKDEKLASLGIMGGSLGPLSLSIKAITALLYCGV